MFGKRYFLLCIGLLVSFFLMSCGGSSKPVGLTLSASTATIDGTNSATFTATVANDKNAAGVTWSLTGAGTLSSQSSTSVTYTAPAATSTAQSATITATSAADSTKTASITITIPAKPTITTTATQLGSQVGATYSATLTVTGGIAPYTWSVDPTTPLPACLTLNTSTGVISGTVSASCAGNYNVTFTVTDSGSPNKLSATEQLTIVITAAPPITFATAPAATGTYNVAYASAVSATGGAGTLTYGISAGALPPDLSLNAATGAIAGTPSKAADVGTFNYTVKAADAFGDSATQAYQLVVSYPAMTITTPTTLPVGYVGSTYTSATLAASGGTGVSSNYTWALASGSSLPAGLTLSTAGVLTGTPTGPVATNTFGVTVMDTVAGISGSATFTLQVKAGVSITTASPLPAGYGNTAYSLTLAATGGSGTGYTWAVTSGGASLTTLNLSLSAGGALSGTPPVAGGSASFGVKVTDSVGNTATGTFSLTVNAGVTVTAPAMGSAYPGTAYASPAFGASGGSNAGYTWSMTAAAGSSVPTGFAINPATGVVSAAAPVNSGSTTATYNVVVTATDSLGNTGSANATIAIEATVTITTPTTLPAGTVGVAYSQPLAAAGGSGTGYTWQLIASNPGTTGLSFNTANGTVTGNSPTQGTATFTVTATDSQSHVSAQATFTVDINNQLKINQTTLPSGNVGIAYSQTLTASGGSGSGYTYAVTSGNLSSFGLSLAASTGVISGTPTQSGTATFTAQVTDSNHTTATQNLSIQIYAGLTLTAPNTLPTGYINETYPGTITGGGGSGNLTLSITSALAPANGTLAASISGNTLSFTGMPTTATTESITVQLTDNTTTQSISQLYTFTISTPTYTLPSANPPAATVGQAYSSSITANITGGSGTYVWIINGSPIASNGSTTALGGSGLAAQFYASDTGTDTLSLSTASGTPPSSTGSVSFTAQIKDTTTNLTSSQQAYTIQVNSAGQNISGQIFLNSNCGGGSGQPFFTVSINYPSAANPTSVTTDGSGNYTFTGIPNGTYTITPSIPGATSSLFYPATYTGVTVNNNPVTGENFNAVVGYTVSGTVSYGGSQSGQTYLVLNNNNCSGNSAPGTSISAATLTSGGAFTIRGVPPGSYILHAWMDPIGAGAENEIDPTGNSSVTVTSANVTNAGITISDPTFTTPSSNPGLKVTANAGGALIFYQPSSVTDSNGNKIEDANQYTVQWSTSPTLSSGTGSAFASVAGSKTFKALGANGATVWVLNNTNEGANTFTSGSTYYFQARSINTLASSQSPSGWSTFSSNGSPAGIIIGASTCSTNCTTVSGAITIPNGVTIASGAPLYVGLYQQSSSSKGPSAIFATEIASPVVGSNSYSISIPSGSDYYFFGILDQNKNGQIGAPGNVTIGIHDNGNASGITVSGSTMTENGTLPAVNSTASVSTQYQSITSSGGSSTNYSLDLQLRETNKLPVAVTLTSGPNVMSPIDMGLCNDCGSAAQFDYYTNLPGGTPAVGDQYNFTVTYSDGSQDTGSTVNGKVTGWDGGSSVVGAADLPTNLAPVGTASTSTTPTFTWTFPANPSDFTYSFRISSNSCSGSCSDIWDVPGNNSNVNGFTYTETSGGSGTTGTLVWGNDPIPGDNSLPTGPLSTGAQYSWSIQAQDSSGNQAQTQTWYQP